MKIINPEISIITVVYNNAKYIEKTISSIINQTYDHIEFIIVDGGSTDGTLDIIRKYENKIGKWISEPDNGLYDAMNKGLQMATGDFVWFINSGDEIYSGSTLENVLSGMDERDDILYGGTMMIDENGNEKGERRLTPPESLTWISLRRGMLVSHQSILVRRGIAPQFNMKYKISADIDWVIRSLKNASRIRNTNEYLSRFMEGGVSRKKLRQGLWERFIILSKYYGILPTLFRHLFFGARLAGFYVKHKRI